MYRETVHAANWLHRFFFYSKKIINNPNDCTILQDICTLFACYLHSALCGWLIKYCIVFYEQLSKLETSLEWRPLQSGHRL